MVLRVEAVRERLAKIEEVTSRLVPVAEGDRAAFLTDYRLQWVAERGIEVGAQAVLDIGNHVLSAHFGASAPDNEAVVRLLAEHGVVRPDLATRLRGLGGMRNLLAHGYLRVEPVRVWDALQRCVADFTDFGIAVDGWLSREAG